MQTLGPSGWIFVIFEIMGGFGGTRILFLRFFDRPKNQQESAKKQQTEVRRKRCQGRRARNAGGGRGDLGKVYQALRGGGTPPGTSWG